MRALLFPFAVVGLLASIGTARSEEPGNRTGLPAEWAGVWKGTTRLTTATGETQEVVMELHIRPLVERKATTWKIVYGTGGRQQTRNYELLSVEGKPGRFVMDEKNGSQIDCQLVGDVLYSQFQVSGNLVSSRYHRQGNSIHVEMTIFDFRSPRRTEVRGGKLEVQSYTFRSVQAG